IEDPQQREVAYKAVRRLMWEKMRKETTADGTLEYIKNHEKSLEAFLGKESLEEMENFAQLTKILEKNPNPHVSEPEFNALFALLEKMGMDPLKIMTRVRHSQMGFVSKGYIATERLVHFWKNLSDKHYQQINKKIMMDGKQLSGIAKMLDLNSPSKELPEKVQAYMSSIIMPAKQLADGEEEIRGSSSEPLTAPTSDVPETDADVPVMTEQATEAREGAPIESDVVAEVPVAAPVEEVEGTISAEENAQIDATIPPTKEKKQATFLQKEAKSFETYEEFEESLRGTFQELSDKGQTLNEDAFERIKPRIQAAWDATHNEEDQSTLDAMEKLLSENRGGIE
ncbi:MAG: hypothetical protein V3S69_03400, partial [Dehalococcoidales bacterium]